MIDNRIISGDVRCLSMEGACMFHGYYEVCRPKGIYVEKTQLVEVEDDTY